MSAPRHTALFLPHPGGVEASLAHARWADEQGFDALWCADRGDVDVLTLAGSVLAATERIRLGVAVTPVFTRTPAVLASTAMTLSRLAPQRFALGIGASSAAMVENWHGQPWRKPLTRVRETATVLRALLAGERTDFQGETVRSRGFRLQPPPLGRVPLFLAGMRPRSLELAGELGDGVAFNMTPLQAVPRMRDHIAAGAARAGRAMDDLEVVCNVKVAISDDPPAIREYFRQKWWGYYITPIYNRFLEWCGWPEQAATIRAAWQQRDREGVQAALSDDIVDALVLIGDADTCRARLREFHDAGVTTVVVHPVPEVAENFAPTCAAFRPGAGAAR